jgi:hypothetical protein
MDSIPALIGETFRGDRALLAADCCYSGELAKAVERQAGRVGYAVFASSSASELSTGNWTFTEALLDGLRGHAGCDLDDDGRITLAELGRYIAADMRVGEGQLATFFAGGPFPEQSVLALAGGKASPRVGERVKVTWQGQPYNARITDADGDRYRVHWLGFRDYPDEWVAAGTVAFPEAAVAAFARGTIVEVQWKSRWYPATVLDVRDGIFYIHYTGYGSEWDEWVSAKRIRRPAS